ncbi:tryptophan-rich sensory protein [Brevibacterium yomogidense]|uniref:Tryptophan-rich sensory protein n=1 Tax=Brevibacterium yomogidense TaxID=946573 RepID=A0A1X6X0H7_9MICO|nr:tryptophan-rich sensory protein [Brevibacterium yomogidense]SLM91797.1 hypothetical protein FM105_02790 [Brevibacterium yomogidense]
MDRRTGSWTWAAITIVAVAVSIAGSFIGSGALGGTPIAEAAGGALSADATPLAPGGGAFSIWSVIYAGLAGYALWQLFPTARSSSRQRSLRLWAIASALLNAAWIWSVQLGLLIGSVVVIAALLIVLIRMLQLMEAYAPQGRLDMLLTDGTFGLYLGWVTVATVANVAALTAAAGIGAFAGWQIAASAVVVLAGGIGVGMAVRTRGRLAPAVAVAWGLAWIAVGRVDGGLESTVIAWVAGISAAVVLLTAVSLRLRRRAQPSVPRGENPEQAVR